MAKKMGSFQKKATKIEKGYEKKGMSEKTAKKIAFGGLANSGRNASSAAKSKNPNLDKISGAKKKGSY